MSVPGTPTKTFSTPLRPVTHEKFQSLREKVIRESPNLYKTKVLSDPTTSLKFISKSVGGTPLNNVFSRDEPFNNLLPSVSTAASINSKDEATPLQQESDLLPDQEAPTQNTMGGVDNMAPTAPSIGDFESPALSKFTGRIVNKELETKKIISNVIVLLVWNLALKFLTLFLYHMKTGKKWRKWVNNLILERVLYKINPHLDIENGVLAHLTITNVSHVVHLMIFCNIIASVWRLLVKSQSVQIDDLHLNARQKELLGVMDTPTNSKQKTLPRVVLSSATPLKATPTSSSNAPSPSATPTPFLFKSLRTPLKSKEQQRQQQQQQQQQQTQKSMSAFVNKVNAFGDLRKTALLNKQSFTPTPTPTVTANPPATPTSASGKTGYIPSSKYAYMMESPSPRKRI